MPNYTLNRDFMLRTTDGVISFVKGEPAWVPPNMVKHAVGIGAEPVDGAKPDLTDAPEAPEQLSDEDRKALILAAFEQIKGKNDSKDFTGAGCPTVKAVERIVEFAVERTEVAELWNEFKVQGE